MMTDVTVIAQRLAPIAEAGKNVATLQTLVKDKPVPRKNVSQTMAGLLKRSSTKKEDDEGADEIEVSAPKDDGDEDGESLGILPEDQKADEKESDQAKTTAQSEPETATEATSSPVVTDKDTSTLLAIAEAEAMAPVTPPKNIVTETRKLEPAVEDERVTTEALVATSNDKELPVEPVSPMDGPTETSIATINHTLDTPAPPAEDTKTSASTENNEEPEINHLTGGKGDLESGGPEIPPKT